MIDLPAPLPEGESVLWEGTPRTWSFARQVLHPSLLLTYVGVLLAWCLLAGISSGDLAGAALASAKYGGLCIVAFILLAGTARLQVGSTDYVITNRRVMITFGAALGKTLQIPFASIESAALRAHGDGTGDLVLKLMPGQTVNFLLLWPNVRPWKFYPAEPMLRAVPDAEAAAQVLARALAAHAGMSPVPVVSGHGAARPGTVAAAA
jgi:hypothetical protein